MPKLPSKSIMNKLYAWGPNNVSVPANSTVALQDVFSVDYTSSPLIVKDWVGNLTVFTNTDMGTSDSNLTTTLSANVNEFFFIANINTTPEYLFCFSEDRKTITTTVWLKGYSE